MFGVCVNNTMKEAFTVLLCVLLCLKCGVAYPAQDDCSYKTADVIFALDSSHSIWEEDFHELLRHVSNIIDALPVNLHGVHVGVVTFGTDVHTHINLNGHTSKDELLQAVNSIKYHGGSTNTGGAISHAREALFENNNGGREGVAKILFVITDGYSVDPYNTSLEASLARSHDVSMFAVGVGRGLDDFELNAIASRSTATDMKFMYRVDDFKALDQIKTEIIRTMCRVMSTSVNIQNDAQLSHNPLNIEHRVKKYCGGKPADVYIAIDASSSVTDLDFRRMLHFITDVVEVFKSTSGRTRIGVVAYSDTVYAAIPLDNNLSTDLLKRRIRQMVHLKGSTRTGNALRYIRKVGFAAGVARRGVAHVLFVLTDGQSADASATLEESKRLKDAGVYVFAFGIGEQLDMQELKTMGSSPSQDFVFGQMNVAAFASLGRLLNMYICLDHQSSPDIQSDQGQGLTSTQGHPPQELTTFPLGPEVEDKYRENTTDVLFVFDSVALGEGKSVQLLKIINDVMSSPQTSYFRLGVIMETCHIKKISLSSYLKGKNMVKKLKSLTSDSLHELIKKARVNVLTNSVHEDTVRDKKMFIFVDRPIVHFHRFKHAVMRLKFQHHVKIYFIYIGKEIDKQLYRLSGTLSAAYIAHIERFSDVQDIRNHILIRLSH